MMQTAGIGLGAPAWSSSIPHTSTSSCSGGKYYGREGNESRSDARRLLADITECPMLSGSISVPGEGLKTGSLVYGETVYCVRYQSKPILCKEAYDVSGEILRDATIQDVVPDHIRQTGIMKVIQLLVLQPVVPSQRYLLGVSPA
jgi:hypothetical protein